MSAETLRHWLHELGWQWKRAKVTAKDDDPERVEKLARIRLAFEQLRAGGALFFADELDINLLPKVGYQWMPKGEQVEVLTPGTNEKRYLAGALDLTTGTLTQCVWYRKQTGLFLDLLATLDRTHPASLFTHLTVVADNAKIHKAAQVQQWLAAHPRFELLYLPPTVPGRIRLKNTQQTTPGTHRKRNRVQVTSPYHPLTGQTVEVIRPYHRKEDQPYWDIQLPDGTRAFVPESWTHSETGRPSLSLSELDTRTVLALAKIVADLHSQCSQRGAAGHEQTLSPVGTVSARRARAARTGVGRSQSQATPPASGGQS